MRATQPFNVVSTTVHGSASDIDVSSTFRLRSRDNTSKYAIFTQPSITIILPLIVSPIVIINYLLSVCLGEVAREQDDFFCEKLRTSPRLTAT